MLEFLLYDLFREFKEWINLIAQQPWRNSWLLRKPEPMPDLMRLSNNNGKGFTLIEVMVAVAILALSFTSLMSALGHSSKQHIQLRDRFWAQNIAWNQAVNIHLEAQVRLAGKDSGQIAMFNTTWQWQVDVHEASPDLYRIDVDAGMSAGTNTKTSSVPVRITTFVRAPGSTTFVRAPGSTTLRMP